jgi:Ca-activated chloride channel homolog
MPMHAARGGRPEGKSKGKQRNKFSMSLSRTHIIFVTIVAIAFLAAFSLIWIGFNRERQSESGDLVSERISTPLPENSVLVTVASSNTKENWLDQVVTRFNAANATTAAGERIIVEVSHVTSGGSMNAILEGRSQPAAWSPGDSSWVDQLNDNWRLRTNKPLAAGTCLPTIYAPMGFAMWRPMAQALGWPDQPIGWETMVELAAAPEGWARYGRPEWGQFRFGHTHPGYANSGLLSMTTFVYGILGSSDPIQAAQVYDPAVEAALRALQQNTSAYGRQSPALLDVMTRQGPSYLHAAAVPEADVIRFNLERAGELRFPLVFIFPSGGTIWAEHPYCVLDNADWVSEAQAEGAAIFRDYLLAPDQQRLAISNYLRPLDSSIALHAPMDLENGTDPRVTTAQIPALPSPDARVSEAVIDLFLITKRKATVLIVLDISGSMRGEFIKTATSATAEFLRRLHPEDTVGVMLFNQEVTMLAEPQRVGDVVEVLAERVNGVVAEGNTALYDAVCQATAQVETLRRQDVAQGESRLYGIVLLSDGEDTVGRPSQAQMMATCLPTNAEADGVKIFPIAFGSAADANVLSRIASVTGGRLFNANPESISNVYISISAEQ